MSFQSYYVNKKRRVFCVLFLVLCFLAARIVHTCLAWFQSVAIIRRTITECVRMPARQLAKVPGKIPPLTSRSAKTVRREKVGSPIVSVCVLYQ